MKQPQEGSLRINLIRKDGSFDTHQLNAVLPEGADMTDVALHEILDLIQADTEPIVEVDVEDFWRGRWQKVRIVLTFPETSTDQPPVLDLAVTA